MRKRSRMHLRVPEGDHDLLRAAAKKLDISTSELVRRAAVQAAISALRGAQDNLIEGR